jgi:hypothetical protein
MLFSFALKTMAIATKSLRPQDMAELYPNSAPSQKILIERGQEPYRWFKIGTFVFSVDISLTTILYTI